MVGDTMPFASEARPPEAAQCSHTTESDLAKCSVQGNAAATAVANPSDQARPLGIEQYSSKTKPELAVYDEVGPSWAGANGMTSVAATAVVRSADEARPLESIEYSATTGIEPAVPNENLPSRSTAYGASTAAASAVVESADQARPPGIAEHSATTKSDLAVSSEEAGLVRAQTMARPPSWTASENLVCCVASLNVKTVFTAVMAAALTADAAVVSPTLSGAPRAHTARRGRGFCWFLSIPLRIT